MAKFLVAITVVLAALLPLLPSPPAFASTIAASYAVSAGTGLELQSYSAVNGDIYSGGAATLDFGYGIQVPSFTGNISSVGNLSVGLLSNVTGNVNTNASLTLAGDVNLTGNAVYGTTLSVASGSSIRGTTTHQANSVQNAALPLPTGFVPGTMNVTASNNLTLSPGSYGDVTESSDFDTVILSSGNYYLKSLSLNTGDTFAFNIVNNQPINIYSQGNISVASGLNIVVNGVSYTSPTSGVNDALAQLVSFETDGNFANPSGFSSYFFGTIYAPDGNINMQFNNMEGQLIAGGSITGTGYIDYQPSARLQATPVPEPAAGALFGLGLLSLSACWRNWHARLKTYGPSAQSVPGTSIMTALVDW